MSAVTNFPKPDVFWGEMSPTEHLVQFYEKDNVFLDTLEGFVGGGLLTGDSAVVIATPQHLKALEHRLTASGINVNEARVKGQYIALDAEQTLSKFMMAGWPDDVLFQRIVTDILGRARQGGRKVRAFGEMVAVMWARGDHAATLRLEHLWHRLCETESFSLFCAYPRVGFTQDQAASISELCAAHSRVLPG